MTSGFEQAELQGKTATRRVERRLAAILAADVAGYGRLVGADEQGALDRWRAHWDELIKPEIDQHRGRIVRTTGDGILVEFASVVNAVHCAVALQRGLARRNANISADRRIEFRMGVNVGDVIIDRGDMWGDGVNVAARLEALAEPGGLCVSGRVHEDVRGKVAVAFDDLGSRELKNIARPVRIYRARLAAVDQVSPTAAGPVTRSGMGGASILTPRGPALRSGHRLLAGLTLVGVVSSGLAWWGLAPPGPRLTASAVTKAVAPPGEVSITSTTGTQKASALSIAVWIPPALDTWPPNRTPLR